MADTASRRASHDLGFRGRGPESGPLASVLSVRGRGFRFGPNFVWLRQAYRSSEVLIPAGHIALVEIPHGIELVDGKRLSFALPICHECGIHVGGSLPVEHMERSCLPVQIEHRLQAGEDAFEERGSRALRNVITEGGRLVATEEDRRRFLAFYAKGHQVTLRATMPHFLGGNIRAGRTGTSISCGLGSQFSFVAFDACRHCGVMVKAKVKNNLLSLADTIRSTANEESFLP